MDGDLFAARTGLLRYARNDELMSAIYSKQA